jgi:histidinol phosphatase-like enzyme
MKEEIKFLFLDIDGVINSTKYFDKHPRLYAPKTKKEQDLAEFDKETISLVNQIIEATDCEIVISSS